MRHWVVLWSLWAARLVRQPTAPVRVENGLVRGEVAPDGSHLRYTGLRYARVSPDNRFKASQPFPPWEGVIEAYDEHIRCIQRFTNTWINGQEDCLALNIYTPIHPDKLLPVMVYIHGGGFRDGSGSPFLYGPEYLIKHGVIVITFNYRLEILGFLCLGTKEAPGNVGLKDQVDALRWIKKNIKAFGGDPDNVTIFGESAGSASVFYHLLSPMSSGLFHNAIMQSGSAISPWSFQFEPLKTASLLAKQMGHDTLDPLVIHDIFRSKSLEELLSTRVPRKDGDIVLSENIFVPCVEKEIDGVESFLTDTPYNLILKGILNQVPVIMGYNNAEGYMFSGKENHTTISKMNFYGSLPRDLLVLEEEEIKRIAETLKKYYMGEETISKKSIRFAKYEGDHSITYPVVATIDLLAKMYEEPVYAYKLCYDGWLNIVKTVFGFWKAPGATHADDLFYMFKIKVTLIQSFFEMEMVNKMTRMWTNFAKYGNPTPEVTSSPTWEPIHKENLRILIIDKQFSTEELWNDESILFWNQTYTKYRRKN